MSMLEEDFQVERDKEEGLRLNSAADFYAQFKEWVDWQNLLIAEGGIFGDEHRVW